MFGRRNKLYIVYTFLTSKFSMSTDLTTFSGFLRVFNELFDDAVTAGNLPPHCLPSDAIVNVKQGKKNGILEKADLEIKIMERPHSFSLSESVSGKKAFLSTDSKKITREKEKTQQYVPAYIDTSKKNVTDGETKKMSVKIAYYNSLLHGNTKRRVFVDRHNPMCNIDWGKLVDLTTHFVDPKVLLFHVCIPPFGDHVSRAMKDIQSVFEHTLLAQTRQLCMHPTVIMRGSAAVAVDLPLTESYIDDVLQLFYGSTNPAQLHHRFKMYGSAYMFKEKYDDYIKDK